MGHKPIWITMDSMQPHEIKKAIQAVYKHSQDGQLKLNMTVLMSLDEKKSNYNARGAEIEPKQIPDELTSDSWDGPYHWRKFKGSEDDVVCFVQRMITEKKTDYNILMPYEAITRARRKLYILTGSQEQTLSKLVRKGRTELGALAKKVDEKDSVDHVLEALNAATKAGVLRKAIINNDELKIVESYKIFDVKQKSGESINIRQLKSEVQGNDLLLFEGPIINESASSCGYADFTPVTPVKYFDSPRLTASIIKIELSMTWRCSVKVLFCKGRIWIQLCRPNGNDASNHSNSEASIIAEEDRKKLNAAPYQEEQRSRVLTIEDDIVRKSQPGDFLRFRKNVGGGGGRTCLHVNKFEVIINYKQLKILNC